MQGRPPWWRSVARLRPSGSKQRNAAASRVVPSRLVSDGLFKRVRVIASRVVPSRLVSDGLFKRVRVIASRVVPSRLVSDGLFKRVRNTAVDAERVETIAPGVVGAVAPTFGIPFTVIAVLARRIRAVAFGDISFSPSQTRLGHLAQRVAAKKKAPDLKYFRRIRFHPSERLDPIPICPIPICWLLQGKGSGFSKYLQAT